MKDDFCAVSVTNHMLQCRHQKEIQMKMQMQIDGGIRDEDF